MRGHGGDREVERVARADSRAGGDANLRGGHILVAVAVVDHRPTGLEGDAARARVQPAHGHVHPRLVTNHAAAALGHRAVGHVDGTGRGLDVDGAAGNRQVADGGLAHVSMREHREVAGGRNHRGVDDHIRARTQRGEADVAAAVGLQGLGDGECPRQGFLNDAAVARSRSFTRQ